MTGRIFLIIILLIPFIGKAQITGILKGKLIDTAARQPLAEATISVLHAGDSSLVNYSISDKKGFFEIRNLAAGSYFFIASFSGYETIRKSFTITKEKKVFDAGDLIMQKEYKTLAGVVVSDAAPVKVNGDTVSFKADAFKTRPDATVEDVLKKLPGVQVEKDGTVKAMGENVQKVYVDGKEFFGNDPKLATKNITADMVDQIQVYDDMSEQARFTKIDDGSRSKAINIKLKKDKKKGDFGKLTAGGGTNGRYEGNLSFNHFRDEQRISIVGAANNTNKLSYTFNDAGSQGGTTQFSQGGSGSSFSGIGGMNAIAGSGVGSGGINTPRSAGINFNDQWGPRVDFRSSYHFSQSDNLLEQTSFKKYSFPADSSAEVNTQGQTRNKNRTHRVNTRWEFAIDSLTSFLYTANFGKQQTAILHADTSYTISKAVNEYLAITAETDKRDARDGINYNGELLFRRKFKIRGRTFTLGWRNGYNENESDNNIIAPITNYNFSGSAVSSINLNQQNRQDAQFRNNTISASYTEPLGNNKIMELNYAYSGSHNISDKKAFDFNTVSGKYDIVNLYQTNFFEYSNISNRVGANFRLQQKKYNYQLGMAVQFSQLDNRSITATTGKDTTISQRFTNFFPAASFSYTVSRTKSIRFYYRGRTNAPTVSQLQDVPDLSNPLQVKTGNPALKQEFNSNINFNYNSFSSQSLRFFSANIGFNTTGNKIVNSIDSSGSTVVLMKPVNLDGSFNTSGMFTLGFPLKKLKGSNINISTMTYHSRDASLVYRQKYFTTIWMINQTVGFNYSKTRFDLGLAGSFIYNRVKYELQQNSNTEYYRLAWSADFSYRFDNDVFMLSDFDYFINSGRTSGFNQNVFIWNFAIAKKLLKSKSAEIKLTAYDILQQSKGINRTTGDNYVEDIRSNVVPRFFLLSFTYTLRQQAGKKQQSAAEQKMPEGKITVFQ